MSKKTKIAIVGRPNVGKSALFNRIVGKRISIVDEAEGVTRDRLYAEGDYFGRPFELIDTGGIDARSLAVFNEEIKRQAEIAIEEADGLILVVDGQLGAHELDFEVAKVLQRTHKPVVLAVNKVDHHTQVGMMHEFHRLGIPEIVPVSANHGFQIAELMGALMEQLPEEIEEVEENTDAIKVAILGRPNVGKSSLLNKLLGEERCCVSEIAGTTRDSIDVNYTVDGKTYQLIDTAGIRRKKSEHEAVDKFAAVRTQRAIERADVCLLILDSNAGLTEQEKRIANMIEEAGKGCIILLNKWDLVKGFRMEHCMRAIEEDAFFLAHCPKIFISALTGRNLDKIFPEVETVVAESRKRITTHQLNKFLEAAIQKNHPPMVGGKRLRIYYMAQVDTVPPRFIFFINYPDLFTEGYRRYLYNQFREQYGFTGCPLLFFLKKRQQKPREESAE